MPGDNIGLDNMKNLMPSGKNENDAVYPIGDPGQIGGLQELFDKLKDMAIVCNQWNGEEELPGAIVYTVQQHMTPETQVQLIWHLLCAGATTNELSMNDKKLALAMADAMGPDWAQWMYRFAVLVTKLA